MNSIMNSKQIVCGICSIPQSLSIPLLSSTGGAPDWGPRRHGRLWEIGSQCPLFRLGLDLKFGSNQWYRKIPQNSCKHFGYFMWFSYHIFTTTWLHSLPLLGGVNPVHLIIADLCLEYVCKIFLFRNLPSVFDSIDNVPAIHGPCNVYHRYPWLVCSFEHLLHAICYLKVYISVA